MNHIWIGSEKLVISDKHLQITQISMALLDTRAQHLFIRLNVIILLLLTQVFVQEIFEFLVKLNDIFFKVDRKS